MLDKHVDEYKTLDPGELFRFNKTRTRSARKYEAKVAKCAEKGARDEAPPWRKGEYNTGRED